MLDLSETSVPSQSTTEWYVRLHTSFGWWSLLLFLSLGIFLEALHGFKVDWYLDVGNESRRLLWRLAHAHGTFLGLVHIAFTVAVRNSPAENLLWRTIASRCLIGASIAVPGGFFLGGLTAIQGDPGLGILVLPLGAAMLWTGVLVTALRWPAGKTAKQDSGSHRRKEATRQGGGNRETGAGRRKGKKDERRKGEKEKR